MRFHCIPCVYTRTVLRVGCFESLFTYTTSSVNFIWFIEVIGCLLQMLRLAVRCLTISPAFLVEQYGSMSDEALEAMTVRAIKHATEVLPRPLLDMAFTSRDGFGESFC